VTGGHRDTIAYPATPKATGTIASIPSAAFNIVPLLSLCGHRRDLWANVAVAWVSRRLVVDYYGRRAATAKPWPEGSCLGPDGSSTRRAQCLTGPINQRRA
jgi:hypothetical protein